MTIDQDYTGEDWVQEVTKAVTHVQGLMDDRLSDNPAELYTQLSVVESYHSRMTKLLADANARLDLAEYHALMKLRGMDMTVKEKEWIIKHDVLEHRRIRDILDGLTKSMTNKIMLGMSLRKQNNAERQNF